MSACVHVDFVPSMRVHEHTYVCMYVHEVISIVKLVLFLCLRIVSTYVLTDSCAYMHTFTQSRVYVHDGKHTYVCECQSHNNIIHRNVDFLTEIEKL